jgi:hypothetical protein
MQLSPMPIARMPRTSRRQLVAGLMVALLLTGCITTWQSQAAVPQRVLDTTRETEVRITLTSGLKVVLRDPAVEGDSLVGWLKPAFDAKNGPTRRAFSLEEVRDIAVQANDFGPNVILGVVTGTVIFFGTAIAAWAIICATQYCD